MWPCTAIGGGVGVAWVVEQIRSIFVSGSTKWPSLGGPPRKGDVEAVLSVGVDVLEACR
jgi:hypothetical protein